MPRVGIESERLGNGGYVISAHVKDWDLLQSFPNAIVQEIVDGIVKRFIEENGDMILSLVKDPELLATALSKEVAYRTQKYITDKKKREEERFKK